MANIQIFVSLDPTATDDPPVILKTSGGTSARDVTASNGDTIIWRRQDPMHHFDIVDLQPSGEGTSFQFKAIGGSGQFLTCLFQPTSCDEDEEFPYTLYVEYDGTTYTTTDPDPEADDDRPVVRN